MVGHLETDAMALQDRLPINHLLCRASMKIPTSLQLQIRFIYYFYHDFYLVFNKNIPAFQMVVDVPIVVEIRYEIGRIIGDGNFAVVREGVDRRTKNRFALKLIDKKRCQGKEVVLESEVQVLSRLRHPNVVKLYDVIDANSILCLDLELVEGGDLFDAIAAAGKFSEPEAKRMTSDLASALTYLRKFT